VLRCRLEREASLRVRVYDLRGRLVWRSDLRVGQPGDNAVTWRGVDLAGEPAAGGVYLYRWVAGGRDRAGGKVVLVP
jgi:hypothetical protein